jgi:hypothetical protein
MTNSDSTSTSSRAKVTAPTSSFFGENSSSSSSEKCQQCLNHLTSILTNINSKPKILFEAMGVSTETTTHDDNSNKNKNNNGMFWTMDDDAKGVRLQIPISQNNKLIKKEENRILNNEQVHQQQKQQQNKNSNVNGLLSNNNNDEHLSGFGGSSTPSIHNSKAKEQSSTSTLLPSSSSSQPQHLQQQNNTQLDENAVIKNGGILQRMKTKLKHSFQTKKLATSSINNNNNNTNSNSNTNDDHITLEIQCRQCGTTGPEGSARAYLRGPSPLTIILCTNRLSLSDSEEINEVLTHELIHVFDVHHRKWDLSNCHTLARSEIRAAREAECDSITFGFWKKNCVKDKAKNATKNMFPYNGYDCVNKVIDEAITDHSPFRTEVNKEGGLGKSVRSTINIATSSNNGVHKMNDYDNNNNQNYDDGFIGGRSFTSSYSSK